MVGRRSAGRGPEGLPAGPVEVSPEVASFLLRLEAPVQPPEVAAVGEQQLRNSIDSEMHLALGKVVPLTISDVEQSDMAFDGPSRARVTGEDLTLNGNTVSLSGKLLGIAQQNMEEMPYSLRTLASPDFAAAYNSLSRVEKIAFDRQVAKDWREMSGKYGIDLLASIGIFEPQLKRRTIKPDDDIPSFKQVLRRLTEYFG